MVISFGPYIYTYHHQPSLLLTHKLYIFHFNIYSLSIYISMNIQHSTMENNKILKKRVTKQKKNNNVPLI